jgi:energy-coupling factor transport system permease protein
VRALHPFTLIGVALALPALAWLLPGSWGGLAPMGLALALCAGPGAREGAGFGVLRAALLTAAPFWFFLFLLHGVGGMLTTAPRLTTMIASFFWLVAVLPPARLVEAMVAAGWPASAAFLLSATLSAVPALRERARRIVDAQRCRGLKTRGGPWARFTALRALALPLVLSALHEVDERALALETRGFSGSVRRTPLAPPPDSTRQRALRWGLLLGCLGLLAWRFV